MTKKQSNMHHDHNNDATRRKRTSAEDFCDIARECKTITELSERLGIKESTARMKLYKFRAKGVPIKQFPSKSRAVDWEALAKREQEKQQEEESDA